MAVATFFPCQTAINNRHFLSLDTRFRSPLRVSSRRSFSFTVRASSTLVLESDLSIQQDRNSKIDVFSCPVCFEPLLRKGPPGFNLPAIYRSGFKCGRCNKSYTSKNIFLDLTVTSGMKEYVEVKPGGTELFRSPLVSFLYERGWRQNFNRSGFPGPDEEAFSGVIALDFSENMLLQCYDFIKKDATLLNSNLALVRADISRLPFSSGSVDAVHAGAALHCWPSPSNAIAEITRVMRSGGVFVGTTFLRYTSSTPWFVRISRERAFQNFGYLTEKEIEDLCKSCGLINYSSKIQQSFIMFSAQKP
ncbi:putative methyltransferase, chloroplastic [Cucurbita argyrosperma subsp. argyrosperma]|nr:putative methyltransferase, chloroplastic [Cucurbita argyrosperma subsp. argyrosperma]